MARVAQSRPAMALRRRPILVFAMLVAVGMLATVLSADTANAYSEQRYVVRVLDGDTIEVAKPGKTSGPVDVIRFAGVNTNELGMCHAAKATNRVKELIGKKWVTLSADHASSMAPDGVRYLRFVDRNGTDVGLTLVEESLALAQPNAGEPSRNDIYMEAAKLAQSAQKRIWNDQACGRGPRQNMPLRMIVHWDAHGSDRDFANRNTEYVRIYNDGDQDVSLKGWSFRDSATHIYPLPSFAKIPAGGFIKIMAGAGTSSPTRVHINHQGDPLFHNVVGDGAFLLDPDDDIRAFFYYPCVLTCTDPLKGHVAITAKWDAEGPDSSNPNGEWIDIRNVSSKKVKLFDYYLTNGKHHYDFPKGTSIDPGKRLRIYVGSGTDTAKKKYWGRSSGVLDNENGKIRILTYDKIQIAKFKYPCEIDCTDSMQGKVSVTANYDADGVDSENPNGEWVNITNVSGSTIDLAGYVLKTGGHTYYFNADEIQPGERLRVHVGSGTDTRLKKFWGNNSAILGNTADEVVLMTPDVRIIDRAMWPCSPCGPLPNVKIVDWQWDVPGADSPNDEWAVIKNKGTTNVDLRDWALADNANFYDFKKSHILSPGEKVTIIFGSGSDTGSKLYWGLKDPILFSNDLLELRTPHRDVASCKDWGTRKCPKVPAALECGGQRATLVGSSGEDILVGTSGADVIVGRGGPDLLDGDGGDDIICGGSGDDELLGGAGEDTLKGGTGIDRCRSGSKSGCEL